MEAQHTTSRYINDLIHTTKTQNTEPGEIHFQRQRRGSFFCPFRAVLCCVCLSALLRFSLSLSLTFRRLA
jgi:hypothetical protein